MNGRTDLVAVLATSRGPNARFKVWWCDDEVTLTLRPGQTLHAYAGGATDEGYFSVWESWTHTGFGILRVTEGDSRDCDGRMSTHDSEFCTLQNLRSYAYCDRCDPDEPPRIVSGLPKWDTVSRSQKDYTAEAAGY